MRSLESDFLSTIGSKMDISVASQTSQHFCYVLSNQKWPGKTYAGYTVSPARRLRQHNGGLKGGAKYTARFKPDWEFLIIVTSPQFTKHTGLSFEWSLHHPTNRRARPRNYNGIDGRIRSLSLVFGNKKFRDFEYTIFVHRHYIAQTKDILAPFKNVSILELNANELEFIKHDIDDKSKEEMKVTETNKPEEHCKIDD